MSQELDYDLGFRDGYRVGLQDGWGKGFDAGTIQGFREGIASVRSAASSAIVREGVGGEEQDG